MFTYIGVEVFAAPVVAFLCYLLFLTPNLALYAALFFRLMPYEFFAGALPSESILSIYFVAEYSALALALMCWMFRLPFQREPVRFDLVCYLLVIYVIWASVSLLWASSAQPGIDKLGKYFIGLVLLFLCLNQITSWKEVGRLIWLVEAVGWVLVVAGIVSALGPNYTAGERLSVFGINENQYALSLVMSVPCVIWPVHQLAGWRRALRMASGVLFIVCALVLVLLTGSRGSTLSLIIMLLAFWFAKPLRPWAVVGSGLAACVVVAAPIVLLSLANRSAEKEGWGNELGGRDQLWEASLRLIGDHPLTGVGIGNGPSELIKYVSVITDDYSNRDSIPSHNPILEVGADTGLLGICIYIAIFGAALWKFFCSRAKIRAEAEHCAVFFPLMLGLTASYVISWLKAGGVENDPSFFALLALLVLPSHFAGRRQDAAP